MYLRYHRWQWVWCAAAPPESPPNVCRGLVEPGCLLQESSSGGGLLWAAAGGGLLLALHQQEHYNHVHVSRFTILGNLQICTHRCHTYARSLPTLHPHSSCSFISFTLLYIELTISVQHIIYLETLRTIFSCYYFPALYTFVFLHFIVFFVFCILYFIFFNFSFFHVDLLGRRDETFLSHSI